MATTSMALNTVSTSAAAMLRPLCFNGCCDTASYSIAIPRNSNHYRRRLQHQIAELKLGEFRRTQIKTLNSRQFAPQFRKMSCKAVQQSQSTYQGVYGPWTIDSSDIREVFLLLLLSILYALLFICCLLCIIACISMFCQLKRYNLCIFVHILLSGVSNCM